MQVSMRIELKGRSQRRTIQDRDLSTEPIQQVRVLAFHVGSFLCESLWHPFLPREAPLGIGSVVFACESSDGRSRKTLLEVEAERIVSIFTKWPNAIKAAFLIEFDSFHLINSGLES